MNAPSAPANFVLSVTPERRARAQKAHASVARSFFLLLAGIGVFIAAVGSWAAAREYASSAAMLVMGAAFVIAGVIVFFASRRPLARADAFVSSDGASVTRVDATGITIADTHVPFERVTCVVVNEASEVFSGSGGGARIGDKLMRRLREDGAQSALTLMIGVDKVSTLSGRSPVVKSERGKSGSDDPGHLTVPIGAYFDVDDLNRLLSVLAPVFAERGIPVGVVNGAVSWGASQATVAQSRQQIAQELPKLFTN